MMPPLRVLPPWCRRIGPAPENGRQDGTKERHGRSSDESKQGRNHDAIGGCRAEGALTREIAVGGHDGDTMASMSKCMSKGS